MLFCMQKNSARFERVKIDSKLFVLLKMVSKVSLTTSLNCLATTRHGARGRDQLAFNGDNLVAATLLRVRDLSCRVEVWCDERVAQCEVESGTEHVVLDPNEVIQALRASR